MAKRLNVTFREEKVKAKTKKEKTLFAETELLKKQKQDAFFALAGSFENVDANQMIKDVEESRTIKDMDTSRAD